MRWTPGGTSSDIEDRRDDSGGGSGLGGSGLGGGGFGGIHLGIGGAIIVGILSLVFHQNLFQVLSGSGDSTSSAPVARGVTNTDLDIKQKPLVEFVSFVLDDVQRNWDRVLPAQKNVPYHHAKLVLFRDELPSTCGEAQTAIGPFYCPGDEKVYLDLSFLNELETRFGAPGKFAQAYVIAHEIGHHVQKLLGVEPKVRRLQEQDRSQVNPLSVRLELQADCFAGVWGNSTEQRGLIDQSDVKSALGAAAAVGDDRLQRASHGTINPESFTHGTSAQRAQWFTRGLSNGRIADCNTFSDTPVQ